ncbi:MAG: acyltransferase [Flavobacteriales bacterium]|nr:acyltransferase [Flavobacteriales bacterium]
MFVVGGIPQLTFLRFIAAMLVVLYHYGNETFVAIWPWLHAVIANGAVAVAFFFFLSGVVLGINYLKPRLNVAEFLMKRVTRIFPLYLFAFVVTLVLQYIFLGDLPHGDAIIAQALAVHAWWPPWCLAINYPGWSVSVEVFLYAFLPAFAQFFKRLPTARWFAVLILIWLLSMVVNAFLRAQGHYDAAFVLYFPLWHVGSFAAGLLCAVVIRRIKERGGAQVGTVPLIGSVLLFAAFFFFPSPLRDLAHNGGAAPAFFVLIAALALHTGWFSRLLSWLPLQVLGDASYAVYLLQFPVYLIFTGGRRSGSLAIGELLVYMTVLVATSIFVHRYYDGPMRGWVLTKTGQVSNSDRVS